MLERMIVVVPARDEEQRLGACLASIDVARGAARLPVWVVVVADRCTDATAQVAARFDVSVVESSAGRVGEARALGITHALRPFTAADLTTTWIANTDADSTVPPTWLRDHREAAETGHDLRLGAVTPAPGDLDDATLAAWRSRHSFGPDHEHVFGADLGVRASAYYAVGGFPPLAVGEDVALVRALDDLGVPVDRHPAPPVVTSGRRTGRTPGGFSEYLAALQR